MPYAVPNDSTNPNALDAILARLRAQQQTAPVSTETAPLQATIDRSAPAGPPSPPNFGLNATIAAANARVNRPLPAPIAPTAPLTAPLADTPLHPAPPETAHVGAQLSANASPLERALTRMQQLKSSNDNQNVSPTPWGVEVGPPQEMSRKHGALVGALQGIVQAAANGPTQGTALRALGGAGAGAAAGAVNPRLMQALERHQEEARVQGDVDQAQSTALHQAQLRDVTAQAAERESNAQKVDYTPPGGVYPVKLSPKDWARATQRDHEDAADPWVSYTPEGSDTPLKVRSSVAARLQSSAAQTNKRITEQRDHNDLIDRRLDEQERHNKEMERLGRIKEAKAAIVNINKLKQAKSAVSQYSKERDALEADASALEKQAIEQDAKVDDFGLQDPGAKTKAADLRRQADEKRRSAQRAHDNVIRAQSTVDAIPETPAPAKSGVTRSISAWSKDNPNATPQQRAAKQREWEAKGITVVQ